MYQGIPISALYQAADFLKQHPEKYDYMEREIPTTRQDVGCALGWVQFFAGRQGNIAEGVSDVQLFYQDIGEFDSDWHYDPIAAAYNIESLALSLEEEYDPIR